MEILLLVAVLFFSLFLIPFGLPGTWLMICAAFAFNWLTDSTAIGWATIVGLLVLAVVGEVAEFVLSARYTTKYGGSRRAAWGAIIGGTIGAIVGIPIPVVGSIAGAFAGSFIGALVMEWTVQKDMPASTRAAWGSLVGRVAATAVKVALGCVIGVWVTIAAMA